ncbi:hypothetical protein BBK36DRAFT_1168965 [Trichoderma citrinoviride]|uniref:Uncharacterized protein n=1 Tax=Trichoderma citrinoviride TaxID=58853 RepID=A0A2T4BAW9_9HYPO|nr:hypothetical protein BBK36DRAFT_1168965 [Trichoderma citrinoviride]PTB66359.1 hypothetical protein BBK36DRAFT_1168965 [Trichoderma citrinoviride]
MAEGAPSSITTGWRSLTDETDSSQQTPATVSSHSCPNIFCLPISPWTKTEAHQTSTTSESSTRSSSSTTTSSTASNPSSTAASACLQQQQQGSPSKTPASTMRFNFTDACDADTPAAEDCRVTLSCDTSLGLYPTCSERGRCECLSRECFRKSMCEDLRQCRDYDEAVCMKENSSSTSIGVCGCRPRVTGCLFQESPHRCKILGQLANERLE